MRIVPASRRLRVVVTVVAVLAALVVLWFWVFPWLDRTFVNRPAIEGALAAGSSRGAHVSTPAIGKIGTIWIAGGRGAA